MLEFTIAVTCIGGGTPHEHDVVVQASAGGVHGAATPTPVRLQYRCPEADTYLKVRFTPPIDAARPFSVIEVR